MLAEAVRQGLIAPLASPTRKPPARKSIMAFHELMRELQEDREDR
jgi:hypothetical protein